MIDVSEPLPESTVGIKTIHHIKSDGSYIGYVEASYLSKKDVKTFKRLKRKLKVGQPFGVQVFIDVEKSGVTASTLGREGLLELVKSLKAKLKGVEELDIYFMEHLGEKRNMIGRATDLKERR
jgi:hypothetical protein